MTPVWAGPWLLLQQLVASMILWQGWSSHPWILGKTEIEHVNIFLLKEKRNHP